jgi:hypothetical protein
VRRPNRRAGIIPTHAASGLHNRSPASSRMKSGGNAVAHIPGCQLQAHLGGNLRALYQPVVEETLPDRLRDLLDALERQELQSRRPPQEAHVEVRPGCQGDDETHQAGTNLSMSLTNVGGAPSDARTTETPAEMREEVFVAKPRR